MVDIYPPAPVRPPPGAHSSPATARNREPMLAVLAPRLPTKGSVLEIAAGAGEHAAYLAAAFPHLTWRPTDPDPDALASIAAWRAAADLPNLAEPLRLDAAAPDTWPITRADAIVCINMVHISPWSATRGLLAGAGVALPRGAPLILYGPYLQNDIETAPSNLAFDESLRGRNPAWGLRRFEAVTAEARGHDLLLTERIAMPANNLVLVFRKA